MKNPLIKLVAVSDQPTLLFHGTGKVNITSHSGDSFQIGNEDLSSVSDLDHALNTPLPYEFAAPGKLYGICAAGQSGVAKVQNWF